MADWTLPFTCDAEPNVFDPAAELLTRIPLDDVSLLNASPEQRYDRASLSSCWITFSCCS